MQFPSPAKISGGNRALASCSSGSSSLIGVVFLPYKPVLRMTSSYGMSLPAQAHLPPRYVISSDLSVGDVDGLMSGGQFAGPTYLKAPFRQLW